MKPLNDLPAADRALFFRLCVLNALSLGSFGIVAPAAQSVFLGAFDAAWLPRAWLGVMAAAAAAAGLLRLLRRRMSLPACFASMAWLNALTLAVLLTLTARGLAAASFAVYIWRDVYILILLELFWTLVNVSALARRAGALYGWLSAAGTGGTVLTSIVGGGLARRVGTDTLLWAMVPVFVVIGLVGRGVPRAGQKTPAASRQRAAGAAAPALTARVAGIFAVVATGHVCLTLLDFLVNQAVQTELPDPDRRTQVMSYLHSATNLLSVALQLASQRIIAWLTVGGALAMMPLAMAVGLAGQAVAGGLMPLLGARLLVKGTDHSIYRIAKERVYLPLSFREKTDGKAWVDIAGSRAAKGAASLGLIGLSLGAAGQTVRLGLLIMCLVWAAAIWALWRAHRQACQMGCEVDF